jgi:beta-N-acetylhexosaminidase
MTALTLEQIIGQKLLWSFSGKAAPPPEFLSALKEGQMSGITLFRSLNVDNPAQVRQLTDRLQLAAREAGQPPLLIAADQEGGQLIALGDQTTPFPGNLALGATRSVELAERVGYALGRELAALGVNVDYAPACDVNVNPQNPVIGTRSFGEAPGSVARLTAAMVKGLQGAGIAATAKHFPGHGDTASDSHYGTPIVQHSRERLRQVELPPFVAAIEAGVKLILTAHVAVPSIDGQTDLPATLSTRILRGILREELNFDGVVVTDAMDMRAITQGAGFGIDTICAAAAGADLLLLTTAVDQAAAHASLLLAARRGLLSMVDLDASAARIAALKQWLAARPAPPPLDIVGCAEHQALAAEVAEQSVTLVRDDAHLLPITLSPTAKIAVVMPRPLDLTPADTSSYVTPALAQAARAFHANVDEFVVAQDPADADIAAVRQAMSDYDLIIAGTLNAFNQPHQAELVKVLLRCGKPVIVAALRMPYDLQSFPDAPTYLCTYSILSPSMQALVKVLWGKVPSRGCLPVAIPGLYPIEYGLNL